MEDEKELEIMLKKINNRKLYIEELSKYMNKDKQLEFFEFLNNNGLFVDNLYDLYIRRDIYGFLDFIEDYNIDREVIDALIDNDALSSEDKYHILFQRLLSIDIEKEDYFKTIIMTTMKVYENKISMAAKRSKTLK